MTELAYTIHTGHGRLLEALMPLEQAHTYVDSMGAIIRRFELHEQLDHLEAGQLLELEGAVIRCIDAAEVPELEPETFTHTGILMVRVHAGSAEEARELLAKAASAALEADPFIRRVEGTSVTRNPAPRRANRKD